MPDGSVWVYQAEQDNPDPCHTAKGPFHVGSIWVTTIKLGVSVGAISSRGTSGWDDHTLAGITLRETKAAVRERLGPPTTDEKMTGPDKNVYQIENGDMMYVDYDRSGKVNQIEVFCLCDGKMHVPVDAYGVSLVDDLPTLLRLRGQPIEQHDVPAGGHVVEYKAGIDANWTFSLDWGHIAWITLKETP